MKKYAALLFVFLFFHGVSFAEKEVNVKLGLDLLGNFKTDTSGASSSESSEFGFNISGEYLYSVHEIIRIGAGLEYLFPRGVDVDNAFSEKYSWLPVYAAVLVNPVKTAPELYLRGNIGYTVLFNVVDFPAGIDPRSKKGGIYWALGAGYEFNFGLVFEAMYSSYYSGYNRSDSENLDLTYGKLGINIGYKFEFFY